MKNFILFTTLCLICFSCHKDSIETQIKETIEAPEIITSLYISGQVTDLHGNALQNTEIKVYQSGKLVGTVLSDNTGAYNTGSIPVNPDVDLILNYAKSDYKEKFRSFTLDDKESIIKDVTLAVIQEDATIEEVILSSPLDSTLILIYGYAEYSDGDPVAGVNCRVVWDYQELASNFFIFYGSSADVSDDDGYWEMYVPKNEQIFFQAIYGYSDFGNTCRFDFAPDLPLAPNSLGQSSLPYVDLGEFEMDTEVKMNENVDLVLREVTVKGQIKRCDGTAIEAGTLTVGLGQDIFQQYVISSETLSFEDYPYGPNGEFEVSLSTCEDESISWAVQVSATDTIINWDGSEIYDYEEVLDIGELRLCLDDNHYPGYLDLIIDQDTIMIDNDYNESKISGIGTLWSGANKKEGEVSTSFFLALENLVLGKNTITRLELWESKQENENGPYVVFNTPFNERPATDAFAFVTDIDGQWISGHVEGKVNTTTGQKDIKVNFRVYDK